MSWIVKDTSVLAKYGFKLEQPYDEDDRITAWTYRIALPLELFWVEVMQDDVDNKDNVVEAVHEVTLERSTAYSIDTEWKYYLPILAKLYNDGVLEWRS